MSRWYYTPDNRQRLGPVTLEELRQLALAETIRPDHMVLPEGGGKWRPAAEVKGLFSEPAVSRPPLSVPEAPKAPPPMPTTARGAPDVSTVQALATGLYPAQRNGWPRWIFAVIVFAILFLVAFVAGITFMGRRDVAPDAGEKGSPAQPNQGKGTALEQPAELPLKLYQATRPKGPHQFILVCALSEARPGLKETEFAVNMWEVDEQGKVTSDPLRGYIDRESEEGRKLLDILKDGKKHVLLVVVAYQEPGNEKGYVEVLRARTNEQLREENEKKDQGS